MWEASRTRTAWAKSATPSAAISCGSAIASSSMATEMIKGKTIEEALNVTNKDVVDALGGLPAHKLHCSVLAEEAVKSAVKDYYDKNGIAYDKKKFPECENCESCRMV